ncbi:hypothetical protein Tco_1006392 [Tanacetum coccineum]|uniref:Uncharacterized protein n=1 Tax=Tanacetum coccineum TaxID=301880 RepID=A0ABQ5FIG8_9ASTR
MQAARDRQKNYADLKRKLKKFFWNSNRGFQGHARVSPWKGRSYVLAWWEAELVRWNSKRGPEFTWEREDQFKKKYPHLFTKTTPSLSAALYTLFTKRLDLEYLPSEDHYDGGCPELLMEQAPRSQCMYLIQGAGGHLFQYTFRSLSILRALEVEMMSYCHQAFFIHYTYQRPTIVTLYLHHLLPRADIFPRGLTHQLGDDYLLTTPSDLHRWSTEGQLPGRCSLVEESLSFTHDSGMPRRIVQAVRAEIEVLRSDETCFRATDLLETDRRRREEIRELRAADRTRQQQIVQTLTAVQTLQREMVPLQGLVATLQGQVTDLQGQVMTLQGQVTTLQGQQGPAGGPAQPELPEEAGSSS